MHVRRGATAVSILSLALVAAPSAARMSRPPEMVGPWFEQLGGACSARIEKAGGTGIGAAIPIPALRLGRSVDRGSISFSTGGSGTGNATQAYRRKLAGLQYEPKRVDVTASTRPEVFSAKPGDPLIYQHLLLKSDSSRYDPGNLIFAHIKSATAGRIASLQLTLQSAPTAAPKLRIVAGAGVDPTRCQWFREVDIYAPAMTAERLVNLFGTAGCNWHRLASCSRSGWPRGHVLFVQRRGTDFVHRWVDYDLLGKGFFDAKMASR